MKTFILDIIPKIKSYSKRLDDASILQNKPWIFLDENTKSKIVYIFRSNGQLLISNNGIIEKAKWEFINNELIMIETKESSFLFRHGFLDENILALNLDGQDGFALLINEIQLQRELNSYDAVLKYLENSYIKTNNSFKEKEAPIIKISFVDNPYVDGVPEFKIIKKENSWTLLTGSFERIHLEFVDGLQGFYLSLANGTFTCDMNKFHKNEKECILNLYNYLKR